ncbi:unnamed protein product [Vicia faba]|uniref:Uncharacterized protein n=1 Tax=Vicia faba TaxID=3906 RepID=A0AAV1AWQ7_VICFA|nr:unnamed protein product [Vicia faba]
MQGRSPGQESIGSGTKRSSVSSGSRSRNQKEFFYKFVDSDSLNEKLVDWFESITEKYTSKQQAFDVPFELIELQKFDYALEGIPFQQLTRMPNAVHASASEAVEATSCLAIEDFLHASMKGLWEAFWSQDEPMPFSAACLYNANMKFYQAENAIANGRLGGLCGTGILLNNSRHPHGKWDHLLELTLLRTDIRGLAVGSDRQPSLPVLGEALFYAIRMLLARSLSRLSFFPDPSTVFVLLVDSQYGGVVKVEGDNLEQARKCKLGRYWCSAAADHSSRLQTRRIERQLGDTARVNGNGLFHYQQRSVSPEIVEVQDDYVNVDSKEAMKLEEGSLLWLEDSDGQKGYQIQEVINTGELTCYIASYVEDPGIDLFLYVGSHPSQLEPAWEDMNLWYQVQRQTKVLTIMKQKGLSSKYLPELIAFGRIIHPGHCRRPSSGGNCDHPWCGTPVLVTSPIGETVAEMVESGRFGSDEAIKCCHDCLSALSTATSAGLRHGDIRPENVICVRSGVRHPYFVLIGWGHAILEDRDRPAMNLHFSSTYALQEGKLCSASDAESLVYMLYYSCGGVFPDLDSVEGALQWRETSWSRRSIQQKLGDISTLLKAFADYVDSLCGTPYPMNYDIWLRRLTRNIQEDDHGKEIVRA